MGNRHPTVAVSESTALAPVQQKASGGYEGAERLSREMFSWRPAVQSPDMQINRNKDLMDARGRDAVQNDGYMTGAMHIHRDSIVGSKFSLICTPDWEALGATEEWADKFSQIVESRFNLMAGSTENWFDAAGQMTFTDIIRLGVVGFGYTGEVLATAEWLNTYQHRNRPFKTAIQSISPTRLSNPNGSMDTADLRAGIERDMYGRSMAYHIRTAFPGDYLLMGMLPQWKRVPAYTKWNRRLVMHIKETMQPDQTRGVSDMVSVLKQMKMTKKFNDIVLQNAVVNATYAAAIESELPTEAIFQSMGAGGPGFANMLGEYMTALTAYVDASDKISVDGVKMPHLFPGTKLNLQNAGTPGGVGTDFEESLLRHIASPLGLSYEQFSKDYTKTNYSSARASMAETWKFMQGRKKTVADKYATMIYILWLEEEINREDSVIPLPPNFNFYDPYMREALCSCEWVGAARGQIDETKETQAALMRIAGGLSNYQKESALLGDDFRKVWRQRAREQRMMEEMGLTFDLSGGKGGGAGAQQDEEDPDEQDAKDNASNGRSKEGKKPQPKKGEKK
jgi:lambda family phage portal protein